MLTSFALEFSVNVLKCWPHVFNKRHGFPACFSGRSNPGATNRSGLPMAPWSWIEYAPECLIQNLFILLLMQKLSHLQHDLKGKTDWDSSHVLASYSSFSNQNQIVRFCCRFRKHVRACANFACDLYCYIRIQYMCPIVLHALWSTADPVLLWSVCFDILVSKNHTLVPHLSFS